MKYRSECIYLWIYLEVINKLFVDCLGFMAVNEIKKHLFGFTQTSILTLALISEKMATLSILDLVQMNVSYFNLWILESTGELSSSFLRTSPPTYFILQANGFSIVTLSNMYS